MSIIVDIRARQIFDSRGNPTVEVDVITESGILAAAHLAGPGNVKKFFKKGVEFKDGNGTKMTSYLTQFSGYELNIK